MDFFEVVIRNKRFKEFEPNQTLSSDQIKQLLACAQLAPSLSDTQNFTYIIVSDSDLKQQIAEKTTGFEWIKEAAAIFAVVVVTEEEDDINIIDAIVSSSQLMMAATATHLGSNFIVDFDQDAVAELLGVVDTRLTVMGLISIGATLDEGSQGYKRTLAELSNHNKLGEPYNFD
ncbi:MAG: nitroreductase family protein [Candidatus Heimdallarchaeota archaeon]|nr:MAG: nitroreductase family protein [Candidatus Heimdallarchaeota archaeon]